MKKLFIRFTMHFFREGLAVCVRRWRAQVGREAWGRVESICFYQNISSCKIVFEVCDTDSQKPFDFLLNTVCII